MQKTDVRSTIQPRPRRDISAGPFTGTDRGRSRNGGAREPLRQAAGRHPDASAAHAGAGGGRDQPQGVRGGDCRLGWSMCMLMPFDVMFSPVCLLLCYSKSRVFFCSI